MQSLGELIDAYELEIECSRCNHSVARSIGFLKDHWEMSCPHCTALMLLGISRIRQEMRHIERQMSELYRQLHLVVTAREQAGVAGVPEIALPD